MSKILFSFLLLHFVSQISSEWTQEREQILDQNGHYFVHWSIDYENKLVRFNVTCLTTGYVGFGLSTNGGMTGSDIVIGGVHPNGTIYFEDRHATGFSVPIIDVTQNWELLGASENGTHTFLQFQRLFDTCDISDDLPITNDTSNFIWSFGPTDEIEYHGVEHRGSASVNILDPEVPPPDLSQYKSFEITQNITMPSQDTTYWCSVAVSPPFNTKHQLVVFDAKLGSSDAVKHTHHYVVYKCIAPEGQDPDEYFGQFVGQPGNECYSPDNVMPTQYCRQILFVWGIGGKGFALPETVGYPVGESSVHEYYMLELHYDNPELREGVQFETGAVIYYTDQLREYDAGVLYISHQATFSLTVPPKTDDFIQVGHCDSSCTVDHLPPEGINVFAVYLHSHLSGRGHRLRHFRNGEELPWAANDDNYNFEYQQTRLLHEPLKILPGDHLSAECKYSTNWRDGISLGGFSSSDEMCEHFLWHWPKSPLHFCFSALPGEEVLKTFGIESTNGDRFNPIITSPEHMANKTYRDALNTIVEWTPELRAKVQTSVLEFPHEGACVMATGESTYMSTAYPAVSEAYQPVPTCSKNK